MSYCSVLVGRKIDSLWVAEPLGNVSSQPTHRQREEGRFSSCWWSKTAMSSTFGFSLFPGHLCQWVGWWASESWDGCSLTRSASHISSRTASSLWYQVPFSMDIHLFGKHTRSSLKGYLPFVADKSCLHRVKVCVLFLVSLSVQFRLAVLVLSPQPLSPLSHHEKLSPLFSIITAQK